VRGARRRAAKIAADARVRVVFVRGAGPVFCAGADLKERTGKTMQWVRERRLKAFAAYQALEALPLPVIAVVHGPALGAAIEISSACDFILATPDATFGTPEALRGTVGATQRLPRVIGKRLAKDLMFTDEGSPPKRRGSPGSSRASSSNRSSKQPSWKSPRRSARRLPDAMRLAKRCIDQGVERDPQGALEVEIAAIDEQLASGSWMGKQ